jgi:hypothetical protein
MTNAEQVHPTPVVLTRRENLKRGAAALVELREDIDLTSPRSEPTSRQSRSLWKYTDLTERSDRLIDTGCRQDGELRRAGAAICECRTRVRSATSAHKKSTSVPAFALMSSQVVILSP